MIKSGNGWHAGVDRRGFGIIKQDFIPLFYFMYVQNLWQAQKAVLTIVEFEFFDIFYSKFQLVSTFSICSQFCVENLLFCSDLSCKCVTCRSGCKRFWKSALLIYPHPHIGQKSTAVIQCWLTKGYRRLTIYYHGCQKNIIANSLACIFETVISVMSESLTQEISLNLSLRMLSAGGTWDFFFFFFFFWQGVRPRLWTPYPSLGVHLKK